ncbi:MAG: DUF4760 domain-containing protein [Nitrospira sp.]
MNWTHLATVASPIVQAIASLFGVLGVFLVWRQVREAARQVELTRDQVNLSVEQMRQQNVWNKIQTQHTLLSILPTPEVEREMLRVVQKYREKTSWQFPQIACEALYTDLDDWLIAKSYISAYERWCAAISANLVDEDYAYSVHGVKIIDAHRMFKHYIDFIRTKSNDTTLYLELQKVATRWADRAKREKVSIEAEQARLRENTGMQRALD